MKLTKKRRWTELEENILRQYIPGIYLIFETEVIQDIGGMIQDNHTILRKRKRSAIRIKVRQMLKEYEER